MQINKKTHNSGTMIDIYIFYRQDDYSFILDFVDGSIYFSTSQMIFSKSQRVHSKVETCFFKDLAKKSQMTIWSSPNHQPTANSSDHPRGSNWGAITKTTDTTGSIHLKWTSVISFSGFYSQQIRMKFKRTVVLTHGRLMENPFKTHGKPTENPRKTLRRSPDRF